MKKTIITAALLLGLTSAASAEVSTLYDLDNPAVSTTYVWDVTSANNVLSASDIVSLCNPSTSNWWPESTLTFELDETTLLDLDLLGTDTIISLATINTTTASLGLGLKNVEGENKLVLMWKGDSYTDNAWTLGTNSGKYSFVLKDAGGMYTDVYDAGADTPALLYNGSGYGTTAQAQTVTSVVLHADYVDSFCVSNAALNATADGIGMAARIIPEPTTATLSLLALAGLAARRRRK